MTISLALYYRLSSLTTTTFFRFFTVYSIMHKRSLALLSLNDAGGLDIPWFVWLVIVVVTVFLILVICCTIYFTVHNIRV